MRIVIVEDSRLVARLIGLLVGRRGWSVVGRANSADEARALVEQLKPDVVTLDLTLPGGGSMALIHDFAEGIGVPVVVISAATYEGSPAVIEALKSGAEACLDKASIGQTDLLCDTLAAAARGWRPMRRNEGAVTAAP